MYLVRGLLNALQEYTWDENSDGKAKVYMNAVCLLSAACQVRTQVAIYIPRLKS